VKTIQGFLHVAILVVGFVSGHIYYDRQIVNLRKELSESKNRTQSEAAFEQACGMGLVLINSGAFNSGKMLRSSEAE